MNSVVFCIDNGIDYDFDEKANNGLFGELLIVVNSLAKDIHLEDNRNRISLMTSSPWPQIVLEFTTSLDDITRKLEDISLGDCSPNDFVQCLCKGRQNLNAITSLQKNMLVFVRTRINSEPELFKKLSKALIMDCSPINFHLFLFGPKLNENKSTVNQVIDGTEHPFLFKSLIHSTIHYEILEEIFQSAEEFGPEVDTTAEEMDTIIACQLSNLDNARGISADDREAIRKAIEDLETNEIPSDIRLEMPEEDEMMTNEEVLNWFCNNDTDYDLGIDTISDTNLKSESEIMRLRERLKTEKIDEKTRKTIDETLKQAIDAIKLGDNADNKQRIENNTVKVVTEDDLTKALRLSMVENYKKNGQNNGSKTTDIKPLKRKIKKFKEGTKDD